ncbi:hypothetical protein CDAR_447671 [Caerostris darwini]|uniref:Uncharacterized protein n=1 Tax=Caerostris darwini TaxID=1538125 RepID=A0AAV4PNX4_9ARAC|nr:hypothetical protein CDAR_447671 [Caerostris darwini]
MRVLILKSPNDNMGHDKVPFLRSKCPLSDFTTSPAMEQVHPSSIYERARPVLFRREEEGREKNVSGLDLKPRNLVRESIFHSSGVTLFSSENRFLMNCSCYKEDSQESQWPQQFGPLQKERTYCPYSSTFAYSSGVPFPFASRMVKILLPYI